MTRSWLGLQLQVCGSGGCNVIPWPLHNAGELCSPLPAAPGLASQETENKQDLVFSKVRVRSPLWKMHPGKRQDPTSANSTNPFGAKKVNLCATGKAESRSGWVFPLSEGLRIWPFYIYKKCPLTECGGICMPLNPALPEAEAGRAL